MCDKVKILINELKQQASWFECESEGQRDQFKKGWLEGKADQSRKIIEALETDSIAGAIAAMRKSLD